MAGKLLASFAHTHQMNMMKLHKIILNDVQYHPWLGNRDVCLFI